MSTLERIQNWFSSQCDGSWEREHGIIIESCENPGWWVSIDLAKTALRNRRFDTISENIDIQGYPTAVNWLRCYTENNVWKGAGDNSKLELILETFLKWADQDNLGQGVDT